MPFKLKYQCNTTGWKNNCGLNCFTHFLVDKLESGDLKRLHGREVAYTRLRNTFQSYYSLPRAPTWQELKDLFEEYTNPIDREAILSPVLRQYLGELMQDADIVADLFETDFATTFLPYLERNKDQLGDVSKPVIKSNLRWFKDMREQYEDDEDEEKYENYLAIGKIYWEETGAVKYAKRMGDLQKAEFTSFQHLSLLAREFGMGLEVYGMENDQPVQWFHETGQHDWNLKIILNESEDDDENHWEFEDFNRTKASTNAHNAYYDCYIKKEKNAKQNKKDTDDSMMGWLGNALGAFMPGQAAAKPVDRRVMPKFNLRNQNITADIHYTVVGWMQVHFEEIMGAAIEEAAPVHAPQAHLTNNNAKKRKLNSADTAKKKVSAVESDDDSDDDVQVVVKKAKKKK